MSAEEHKRAAPKSVNCMVVTVSDTRTQQTDKSGNLIKELLLEAGHAIVDYRIVKDDREEIVAAIQAGCGSSSVQAILINGGTGISQRDVTYEAVESLLDKQLPGFGEIFRYLSYTEDIGTAAILSRAIAGVCQKRAIFSMPGSAGAVRLAMSRIVLPELPHVILEIHK